MLRVFPVNLAARPTFEDTYGAPRGKRTHEGADIFAPEGTEVYAVDDGRVEYFADDGKGIGGNVATLHATDTTRYVYSHLHGFAGVARKVKAGELIGYVGKTGNAKTTPPHLHFEIHPLEGASINPTPALKAARDAQVNPPPATPPATPPAPSPPAALEASFDGLGAAVLLWLAWKYFHHRHS